MSQVLIGTPYVAPPPPPKLFESATFTWTGWDGSVWDLCSDQVALLDPGMGGVWFPPFTDYTSQLVGMDGQRFRGVRVEPRMIDWIIRIKAATTADWLRINDKFWSSFHPRRTGTWTIRHPTGMSRMIDLRLTSSGDHAPGVNPLLFSRDVYPVTLVADDPLFYGNPVERGPWGAADPVEFFDPAGSPPFHISGSMTTASATIQNPGDVPAWPVSTVTANGSDVTVTLTMDGGSLVPPTIPDGKTLIIDTDPSRATAQLGTMTDGVLTGATRVTGDFTTWTPRPVPDGAEVPVGITMAGQGVVSMSITPRWFRPW